MAWYDDPAVMGLLANNPQQARGLLGASSATPAPGLLGSFQPGPDESFTTRLFGDPRNARDPRGSMMTALATGLIRGDLAGGFEAANRAFTDTEDRYVRRMANGLTMTKSAMEVQAMQQAQQRAQAIAQDRQRLAGAQQFAALPNGSDSFGVPTAGDVPLFSMGSRPGTQAMSGAGMPPQGGQGFPMPGGQGVPQQPPQGYGGGAGGGGQEQVYRQLLQEAELYQRHGDTKTAMDIYQRAEQFRPKFSQTMQVVKDPRTGQLVNVVMGEDGTPRVVPFGVKPDIELRDLGGTVGAIDRNETRGGQSWTKTPTFADRNSSYSNSIAARNAKLAEQRFQHDQERFTYDQNKPEIKEINGQFVAVYPNGGGAGGGPRMAPVAGGENLPLGEPKLTEAQGNATQFATRMKDATRTLQEISASGEEPWTMNVERAGYKPQFPSWLPGGQLASSGIAAANKGLTSESALMIRQAQDNWITANLRKESGAAIPPAELEQERAKWFPQWGEGEKTAQQKERARLVAEEAMLTQTGPGKRLVQQNIDKTAPRGQETSATPLPPNPTSSNLQKGKTYTLPNGKAATWDGFQFKAAK